MKRKASSMLAAAGLFLSLTLGTAAAATITFEELLTEPGTYRNGSDVDGAYVSGGATFRNSYTLYDGVGYWSGFAISNTTDTSTAGFGNQYSAYAGGGAAGSSDYALSYGDSVITFSSGIDLTGLGTSITNTTYAALSIRDGDGFSRQFAAGDWFKLTISGSLEEISTGSVEIYLADYRDGSFILNSWQYLDLSPLKTVDELQFVLTSTDNGIYGMNTPAYFAMDNFLAVPEPGTVVLVFSSSLCLLARRRRR